MTLTGRQVLILAELVVLQQEALGVEVPTRRLSEARDYLAGVSSVELSDLAARLDQDLVERIEG